MRRCVVSMIGKDDQLHTLETDAPSLFAAAYAGISNAGSFGGIRRTP